MPSFFKRDGENWIPQSYCHSPWNKAHQSGVAVGGLLAHAIESRPAPGNMQLCRMTIDILRPVPMARIEVACETVRDGSRVQLLEARILHEGEICARALALRARVDSTPASEIPEIELPGPEEAPRKSFVSAQNDRGGFDVRLMEGGLTKRGIGRAWVRPNFPIAPSASMSPVTASAMVADMASAIGTIFDYRKWSFANVDLSIHFIRPPRSLWICVEGETQAAGQGQAIVSTRLIDEFGLFAHAHQTLFVADHSAVSGPTHSREVS